MCAVDGLFGFRVRLGVPSREDTVNRVRTEAMRMLKDERGNVLVLTVLSFSVLISFLAFAIDIGNFYYTQRQLQTFADSAAMAGALEIAACAATTPNCSVMQTAATKALTEGGNPAPTLFLQCAAASGKGLLLTLNNGPCALGTSDPNNANANYVEAVVTENQPTFFAGILGFPTFQISARAEAGHSVPGSNACLNTNSLTLNSGANVTDGSGSTCGINDNDSGTFNLNSSVTVNVGSFNIHTSGINKNCGSCTAISPYPTTGTAVVPDPFAPEIAAGTLTVPSIPAAPTASGTYTYTSGYYPSGITFSGSNTLGPGVYYMGSNVIINSGATISGTGVTIYLANGAGINSNGSASTINLTAPTTGPTAGMLIWSASGSNSTVNLDTGSNSSLGGAVYLPSGQLTLNGGSNVTSYGMVYANTLMVNSAISLSCSSMPGGVCPGSSGNGVANGAATISLAE